jgi:hypothetical protein
MVRRKNEGSFGCEAVARVLGQPNVPECGRGFLYLLSLCSKNSFLFLSVVWSFYNERQRFAAWRSGGFLAQKFNRRTELESTTKLSYEALHPPLRQTAVTGWASFIVI